MNRNLRIGHNWWLVLGLVMAIYFVKNLALHYVPSAFVGTYVLQPILWGLVACVVLVLLPGYRPVVRSRFRSSVIELAIVVASFQISLSLIGGFFSRFGRSPYSFTPLGIITNLIYVSSALVGMELSRAWLVSRGARRNTSLIVGFITLVYTLLYIPLGKIMSLGATVESAKFIYSTVLPLLAENLLASFLAFLGGPSASIAYRGALQALWWFCPILPDLPWALKSLVGTVGPIMGLLVVQSFYSAQPHPRKARRRAKEDSSPASSVITSVIAVLIFWFSLGLFPLHPTLIGGGSMRPAMDVGDIAIVAKVSADVVKQGDIIQFKGENISVLHRVVEVYESDPRLFITKGDANEDPDSDPVLPEQIIGKVVFVVPKMGWGAIAVRQFLKQLHLEFTR